MVSAVPSPGPFPSSPVPQFHTVQLRGNRRTSVCVLRGQASLAAKPLSSLGMDLQGATAHLLLTLHARQLCW